MRMFLNRPPELDAWALCNFVARSISHKILLQNLAESGNDRASGPTIRTLALQY